LCGLSAREGTANGVTLRGMLTAFGAAAVTFMMLMYALERRGRGFIFAFGCGCVLSSAYGFLAGTWPFGIVELIWAGIAFNRYRTTPSAREIRPQQAPRPSAGRDRQQARF
jgi:hypothetical protein